MVIIQTLYFVLPGFIANMMPVVVRGKFNFLDVPVDLYRKLGGKRIFGNHKTIRGFIFGVGGAILVAYIQMLLARAGLVPSIVDFSEVNFVIVGSALGFGALFGDLFRSFFKRRANVRPGDKWVPWDQIDYILGMILFSYIIITPSFDMILTLIIIGPLLHVTTTRIAYALNIRKEKW